MYRTSSNWPLLTPAATIRSLESMASELAVAQARRVVTWPSPENERSSLPVGL